MTSVQERGPRKNRSKTAKTNTQKQERTDSKKNLAMTYFIRDVFNQVISFLLGMCMGLLRGLGYW
jgi:hypothetical protein